jgi:AcrR family transcriptional regulator
MRQKILDTARALLQEEGYEAFSMRKLGHRLDYTQTAVYYHFRDKAALLQALADHDYAAFSAANAPAPIEDPVERLRQRALGYVEFGLTHPDQYRLLFITPLQGQNAPLCDLPSVPIGNPLLSCYTSLRQAVAGVLESGRFRSDAGDAELITQALWATVHGVVSLHLVQERQPGLAWRDTRAITSTLVNAVLRGMEQSPCAADTAGPRIAEELDLVRQEGHAATEGG